MSPQDYTTSLSHTPATNPFLLLKQIILGRRGLWRIVEDTPETTARPPIQGDTTTQPLPQPPKPRAFALQLAENNNLCLTTSRFINTDPDPDPELDYLTGRTHQNTTTTPMPEKQPLWLARCGSGIVSDKENGFGERPLQQTWLMEGFNIAEEGLSTDRLIRQRKRAVEEKAPSEEEEEEETTPAAY